MVAQEGVEPGVFQALPHLFRHGQGPTMLLTTKGVFHFDDKTKELVLTQLHPGVTLDSVKKDVPWDLKIAATLTETPPPSDAEIDFIRRFSPADSVGKKKMMELAMMNLFRQAEDNHS